MIEFSIPKPPFKFDEFEPHISAEIMKQHYKLYTNYIKKVNKLIKGTDLENASLDDIIIKSKDTHAELYHSAAQVVNHSLFWDSFALSKTPNEEVIKRLSNDFKSLEGFKKEFIEKSNKLFGSGWAWFVLEGGHLKIIITENADNPLFTNRLLGKVEKRILFTIDLFEHTYYPQYWGDREEWVKTFLDNLVNWDRVERKLA